MIEKTNKVGQNEFFKQQITNDEVTKKKVQQEKDKSPDTSKLEANPSAFTSTNANKVLDKLEGKAEANKLPDMSETKLSLKGAFNDLLAAFRTNKEEVSTSDKSLLSDITSKVEPDRKVEVPKLKDSNKENTGASLMVKAVQKDTDNVMDNLQALKNAKNDASNLQDQNKELQTQANLV